MGKSVGLRFLLADGLFLLAVVLEEEAKQHINAWLQGKRTGIIGSTSPPQGGWCWAVNVADLRGVHTVPIESVALEQMQLQVALRETQARLVGQSQTGPVGYQPPPILSRSMSG